LNGLNGYLLSVVGAVLVCAVLTAISPEGKTSAVIKGMTRLVCVLVIVSPILRFLKTGELEKLGDKNSNAFFSESVIRTEEEFIKYYSEKRIETAQRALESELYEKYGLAATVTLQWQMETEEIEPFYEQDRIRILSVHVRLDNEYAEEEKRIVWEYLTKTYCSEVLIE